MESQPLSPQKRSFSTVEQPDSLPEFAEPPLKRQKLSVIENRPSLETLENISQLMMTSVEIRDFLRRGLYDPQNPKSSIRDIVHFFSINKTLYNHKEDWQSATDFIESKLYFLPPLLQIPFIPHFLYRHNPEKDKKNIVDFIKAFLPNSLQQISCNSKVFKIQNIFKEKANILINQKEKLSAFLKIDKGHSGFQEEFTPYYNFSKNLTFPIIKGKLDTLSVDELLYIKGYSLLNVAQMSSFNRKQFPNLQEKTDFEIEKHAPAPSEIFPNLQEKITLEIEKRNITQWSFSSIFTIYCKFKYNFFSQEKYNEKIQFIKNCLKQNSPGGFGYQRRGHHFSQKTHDNVIEEIKKRLKENPLECSVEQINGLLWAEILPKDFLIRVAEEIVQNDIQRLLENREKVDLYTEVFKYVFLKPETKKQELKEIIGSVIIKNNMLPITQKILGIPSSIYNSLSQYNVWDKSVWFENSTNNNNNIAPSTTDLLSKYFYLQEKLSQDSEDTKDKWSLLFQNDKNPRISYNATTLLTFLKDSSLPGIQKFFEHLRKKPFLPWLQLNHNKSNVTLTLSRKDPR